MIYENIESKDGHYANTGLMARFTEMRFPLTNTGQDEEGRTSQPGLAPPGILFGNISHLKKQLNGQFNAIFNRFQWKRTFSVHQNILNVYAVICHMIARFRLFFF